MDLLVVNTKENEKDWEFLNCLWQYVLISKNISRTLPKCLYCGYKGEFCFEGFGAIKKVGNGIMYIPDSNDKNTSTTLFASKNYRGKVCRSLC